MKSFNEPDFYYFASAGEKKETIIGERIAGNNEMEKSCAIILSRVALLV